MQFMIIFLILHSGPFLKMLLFFIWMALYVLHHGLLFWYLLLLLVASHQLLCCYPRFMPFIAPLLISPLVLDFPFCSLVDHVACSFSRSCQARVGRVIPHQSPVFHPLVQIKLKKGSNSSVELLNYLESLFCQTKDHLLNLHKQIKTIINNFLDVFLFKLIFKSKSLYVDCLPMTNANYPCDPAQDQGCKKVVGLMDRLYDFFSPQIYKLAI